MAHTNEQERDAVLVDMATYLHPTRTEQESIGAVWHDEVNRERDAKRQRVVLVFVKAKPGMLITHPRRLLQALAVYGIALATFAYWLIVEVVR